jgi:hypothetical protein
VASIRDTLLTTLVTRIDAIDGVSCVLRSSRNEATSAVAVIVYPDGEDKELATNDQYQATYRVEALIIVREEDASEALDDSNPYRYIDRMITAIEKVVHTPDSWGIDPDYTDVVVGGHAVEDPSEDNELMARIFITFTYRHNYQDPEL